MLAGNSWISQNIYNRAVGGSRHLLCGGYLGLELTLDLMKIGRGWGQAREGGTMALSEIVETW